MTLNDDYDNEHEFIDGVETVTFTPQKPAGTAVTTAQAKQGDLNRREIAMIAGTAGLSPDDTVWTLWDETLGGNTPKQGDIITDSSSNVWVILGMANQLFRTKWRAVCRKRVT